MKFNRGWFCPHCGPVESAKDKSIAKVKYKVCKRCEAIVSEWTRPKNERDGNCGNCGHGGFELAISKGRLLRCCKLCKEVVNTDKNCEVVREGDRKYAYKN